MQTFLPFPDLFDSVHCLDRQRLGKQRVEAYQILKTLTGRTRGWTNHPAVLMWQGHTSWLVDYGIICCFEWIDRGYKDSMMPRIEAFRVSEDPRPWWLGDERLHASHRSNLLRKSYLYYRRFSWTEADDVPYFWPTKERKES